MSSVHYLLTGGSWWLVGSWDTGSVFPLSGDDVVVHPISQTNSNLVLTPFTLAGQTVAINSLDVSQNIGLILTGISSKSGFYVPTLEIAAGSRIQSTLVIVDAVLRMDNAKAMVVGTPGANLNAPTFALQGFGTVQGDGPLVIQGGALFAANQDGTPVMTGAGTTTITGAGANTPYLTVIGGLGLGEARSLYFTQETVNWNGGDITQGTPSSQSITGTITLGAGTNFFANAGGHLGNPNLVGMSASGNALINLATSTFTVNAAGAATYIHSFLSNAGSVVVSAGILVLDQGSSSGSIQVTAGNEIFFGNDKTNSGNFKITAGTLSVSGITAIVSSTLDVSGAQSATFGNLQLLSSTLKLGATNASASSIDVSGIIYNGLAPRILSEGTINGSGTLTITAAANLYSLTETGTGKTVLQGATTQTGDVTLAQGRQTEIQGTYTWSAGQLYVSDYAGFQVDSGASLKIQTDSDIAAPVGSPPIGTLSNGGTIVKGGTYGTTHVILKIANSGTVNVQSGALEFDGGGTLGGSFSVASGATLTFTYKPGSQNFPTYVVNGTTFSGGGSVNFLGAQLYGTGALRGNVGLTGVSMVFGTTILAGNDTAQGGLSIYQPATLELQGSLAVTDASSGLSIGGTLKIDAGGALVFNTAISETGAGSISNSGSILQYGTSGTSSFASTVGNNGFVAVFGGVLDFQNAVTGAGYVQIFSGATLEFDGAVSAGQSVSMTGVGATLALAPNAQFGGTLTSYGLGDSIDMLNTTITGATVNAANQLVLSNNGTIVTTIALGQTPAPVDFAVASDGHGGTLLTFAPPSVVNVQGAQTIQAGGQYILGASIAAGSAAQSKQVFTVTVSDAVGLLNALPNGGSAQITGTNSNKLTLTGSVGAINQALQTLLYTYPNGASAATDTVTVTASDGFGSTTKTIALGVGFPSVLTLPGAQKVFAGNPTAIPGIGLSETNALALGRNFIVLVQANSGLLSATPDVADGGKVLNSGSSGIILTGNLTAVANELATLSYTGQTGGTDTIAINVDDGSGRYTNGAITVSSTYLTDSWKSPTSADWSVAGAWKSGKSPNGPIDVTISVAGAYTVGVAAGESFTVHNLTFGNAKGSLALGGALADTGLVSVSAGALQLSGGTLTGALSLAAKTSLTGFGSLSGAVANASAITASGGVLAIGGALSGKGVETIANGATLSLSGSVSGQTISFATGASATLQIGSLGAFSATVNGFTAGDTIDLAGLQVTSYQYTGSNLTLFSNGAQVGAFSLPGTFKGKVFALTADGAGGTNLTLATNAPPVITVWSPQTMQATLPLTLTGIQLDDPDAVQSTETVTVTISDKLGTLTGYDYGSMVVTGSGTKKLTVTGQLGDVQTALSGAIGYQAAKAGNDLLTITAKDSNGGVAKTQTIALTVTAPPANRGPAELSPDIVSLFAQTVAGAMAQTGATMSQIVNRAISSEPAHVLAVHV